MQIEKASLSPGVFDAARSCRSNSIFIGVYDARELLTKSTERIF